MLVKLNKKKREIEVIDYESPDLGIKLQEDILSPILRGKYKSVIHSVDKYISPVRDPETKPFAHHMITMVEVPQFSNDRLIHLQNDTSKALIQITQVTTGIILLIDSIEKMQLLNVLE